MASSCVAATSPCHPHYCLFTSPIYTNQTHVETTNFTCQRYSGSAPRLPGSIEVLQQLLGFTDKHFIEDLYSNVQQLALGCFGYSQDFHGIRSKFPNTLSVADRIGSAKKKVRGVKRSCVRPYVHSQYPNGAVCCMLYYISFLLKPDLNSNHDYFEKENSSRLPHTIFGKLLIYLRQVLTTSKCYIAPSHSISILYCIQSSDMYLTPIMVRTTLVQRNLVE